MIECGFQQTLTSSLLNSLIAFISSWSSWKSVTLKFSAILEGSEDLGRMIKSCCNAHLKQIWATVLWCFLAILIIDEFLNSLPSARARGEYASITILCCLQKSIVYFSHSKGWSSNWLIAGLTSLCFIKSYKWCLRKLLTPISLTFPSFFKSMRARQVYLRI